MTIRTAVNGRRSAFPVGMTFGLVFGALALVRGDLGFAIYAFVLLSLFGAVLAFAPSEWAISQSSEADERQRALNEEAVRWAYMAVISVAVVGLGIEVWRGEPGPFAAVAGIGGFTHMAALAILSRKK